MSVEIDPVELGFHRMYIPRGWVGGSNRGIGPFTNEVSQILKIRNPNHNPVAFKVRLFYASILLSGVILTRFAHTGQDNSPKAVCLPNFASPRPALLT
jgi:hypothetical protein